MYTILCKKNCIFHWKIY